MPRIVIGTSINLTRNIFRYDEYFMKKNEIDMLFRSMKSL
jgi:hypothetical protein